MYYKLNLLSYRENLLMLPSNRAVVLLDSVQSKAAFPVLWQVDLG